MTLEDLADLIRANSANTNRRVDNVVERMEALHAETYGKPLSMEGDALDTRQHMKALQADMAEVKRDVADVKRSLDLAETVAAMKKQIAALEAEVAALKRRA